MGRPDHDATAARGDDSREEQIADVQVARGALFERVESAAGENVFDVERSPGEDSLDHEETRGTLAGLRHEFTVQLGSGLDLVVEEVQGERFGWPPVWQGVFGGIRYEIEHKERIERGSKLLGVLDVIWHVVPQKELVPGFVEEFASELLGGVGEQSRHESTLGGTKPNPQVVFDILDTKAAVLELAAAAAGTRIVGRITLANGAMQTFTTSDPGRLLLTGQIADLGVMDITQLRGISRTAPYFHNNSAATLEAVLDHYDAFFRRAARLNPPPNLPPILSSNGLVVDRGFVTPEERPALLAYLRKL